MFFDEFQCINEAAPNHSIESVLRQVAQLTKTIAFIFSGSNRHLLTQIFNDRNRPFYKLCERITLDRISNKAYIKHLQKAAQKAWGKELPERTLACIIDYTECHPYYVNLLCSRIWGNNPPTVQSIEQVWQQYHIEERSSVAAETQLLSKNQRKLLIVLARVEGTIEPLGQAFIQQANMSKTSIKQSLNFLEQRDYVYRDRQGCIRVLDPLIKSILSESF